MTWDELKEKAKEMGCRSEERIITRFHNDMFFHFAKVGMIFVEYAGDGETHALILTKNRTPEQMLMIMRGLE